MFFFHKSHMLMFVEDLLKKYVNSNGTQTFIESFSPMFAYKYLQLIINVMEH